MDTTVTIWGAAEGEILDGSSTVVLNTLSIEDDGVFPTEDDWKEFVRKVDEGGSHYLADKWVYNEYGTFEVNQDLVIFDFEKPIKVLILGKVREVTQLEMVVEYDWSYLNKYTHLHIATFIDIEGRIVKAI